MRSELAGRKACRRALPCSLHTTPKPAEQGTKGAGSTSRATPDLPGNWFPSTPVPHDPRSRKWSPRREAAAPARARVAPGRPAGRRREAGRWPGLVLPPPAGRAGGAAEEVPRLGGCPSAGSRLSAPRRRLSSAAPSSPPPAFRPPRLAHQPSPQPRSAAQSARARAGSLAGSKRPARQGGGSPGAAAMLCPGGLLLLLLP